LPNPPQSPVAALVGHGGLRRSAIARPSLYDHLHSRQAGESPLEMVVERRVVFGRTTMSTSASGNDFDGRSSRSRLL
jgi:hypothetical protein